LLSTAGSHLFGPQREIGVFNLFKPLAQLEGSIQEVSPRLDGNVPHLCDNVSLLDFSIPRIGVAHNDRTKGAAQTEIGNEQDIKENGNRIGKRRNPGQDE
jgi:hypothetical protein